MYRTYAHVTIVDKDTGKALDQLVDTTAVSSIIANPSNGLTYFRCGPDTFKTKLTPAELVDALGARVITADG